MKSSKKIWILMLILFGISVGIPDQTVAAPTRDKAEAFYKGKTIKIIATSSPGGGADLWIRALVPHLQKHTGAKIILENIPGAGGLVGSTQLYSLSKPDGLTIGAVLLTGLVLADMLKLETARFEVDKFAYIGRVNIVNRIIFASKASGFKSIEDMQKTIRPIRFGVTDKTSPSGADISIISEAFGLKSKIIPGFKGSMGYFLAVLAGRELDAISAYIPSYGDYVNKGELTMVAVLSHKRFPDYPKVPTIFEIPPVNPEGKKLLELLSTFIDAGQTAILAPPGLSEDKRLFLEKALLKSLNEPAVIAWAKKNNVQGAPLSGTECKALVDKIAKLAPGEERPKLKHILAEKYF